MTVGKKSFFFHSKETNGSSPLHHPGKVPLPPLKKKQGSEEICVSKIFRSVPEVFWKKGGWFGGREKTLFFKKGFFPPLHSSPVTAPSLFRPGKDLHTVCRGSGGKKGGFESAVIKKGPDFFNDL